MPSAIVDKGFHVVREIGVQCLASGLHTSGSGADSQRFFRKAGAIVHEPLQISFRDRRLGVLGIAYADDRQLLRTDRRLLDALIDQIALALERKRQGDPMG